MRKNLLQGLVDPSNNPLFFLVVGTFGLTIASNSISDLILNRVGEYLQNKWHINLDLYKFFVFAIITLLIVLAIALTNLSQWFIRRPTSIQPKPLTATFPGLIVIASIAPPRVKSAAQAAIEHHWDEGAGNLRHCWIICGGQKSQDHARSIIDQMQGQIAVINDNDNATEFWLTHAHDPERQLQIYFKKLEPEATDDPNETFKLVNQIYEEAAQASIEPSDVIADYTGGTKSMTAGIVLACANPERRIEFMKPGGYTPDGRADITQTSIATDVKLNFQLKATKSSRS